MTDKPTRGRPLSPRTLRDMALDDYADGAEDLRAARQDLAHAQRRVTVAHTRMARAYNRIVGAQEREDQESVWDGRERRKEQIAPTLRLAA